MEATSKATMELPSPASLKKYSVFVNLFSQIKSFKIKDFTKCVVIVDESDRFVRDISPSIQKAVDQNDNYSRITSNYEFLSKFEKCILLTGTTSMRSINPLMVMFDEDKILPRLEISNLRSD